MSTETSIGFEGKMRGKSDRPVAVWVRDLKHPNSWLSIAFHFWNIQNPPGMMEMVLEMQKESPDSGSHSDFIAHLLCSLGQAISLVSVASSTE